MFRRPTVADFLLDKDPLFARLNLTDDEYALYDKVYQHLKPQTPTPDLVIYLQAPVDDADRARAAARRRLRARDLRAITWRGSPMRYTRFFYQYDEAPLLIVNSERLNFVDDPEHFQLLLDRIASMRGRREFFNLGQG